MPRTEEHPPLDQFFVQGYDFGDQDFPIVAVAKSAKEDGGCPVPADYTACPDPRWSGHVFYSVTPTSSDERVLWLYGLLPGATNVGGFYDPITDTIISETRQRVRSDTDNPSITSLFTDFHRESENELVDVFVTRTYPAGVTSKTIITFEPDNFTYPAIMTGVTSATIQTLKGQKFVHINPTIFAERPLCIAKKITRIFQTSLPSDADILSGLYPINPIRHRYNGFFFNFVTGPVLDDAGNIAYATGSNDPVWGAGVNETYSWSDSVPTATAYLAARSAGAWKMFAPRTVSKLAASLFMVKKVELPVL